MAEQDPSAGMTRCSCGFQQREHLIDCVSWSIIERRKNAQALSEIEKIATKLDHLHNEICKTCELCACIVCDCEKRIDTDNDTFSEFRVGQIACGKCMDNHGECLNGTCQHIRCG